MTDEVVTSVQDGVLLIRINRPDKKNALNRAMYLKMTQALQDADADASVKVAIITGVADSFSAGNDLKDFLAAKPVKKAAGRSSFAPFPSSGSRSSPQSTVWP